MIELQIDAKGLLTQAGIAWAVSTIGAWFILGAFAKMTEIDLNKRIKSSIPVVISIAWYFVFTHNPLWFKIVGGFFVGAGSTTLYDWAIDKILIGLEGIVNTAMSAATDRVKAFFTKS